MNRVDQEVFSEDEGNLEPTGTKAAKGSLTYQKSPKNPQF